MKTFLIAFIVATGTVLVAISVTAANVGEVAPDFQITTHNGDVFRLSDYRGEKPVYVAFWNTWCTYCIEKTPRYNKLREQFGEQIEIIAINTAWSDTSDEISQFKVRYEVRYPTAIDSSEHVTDRYEVINVPTEFIIDTDGIIRYRDHVPEYLMAHLPDLAIPYDPLEHAAPLQSCSR